MLKIAFITNLCPVYRVRPFQRLVEIYGMDFYFYLRPDSHETAHLEIARDGNHFHYINVIEILMRLLSRRYDVVIKCTNGRYITLLSFLITRILGGKFIVWHTFWYNPRTLFRRLSFPIVKYMLKRSDSIVVYGPHAKAYLTALGLNPKKIFIAWQSVDNESFNKVVSADELSGIRRAYNMTGKKVVLFVGRLAEEKGIAYLVKATAKLQDDRVCLMVIGEGPLRTALEKKCVQSQLKFFVFIGKVPNADLYKYYALADVFVLPSITTKDFKEPWGLVVNEAMNQGTPVVVTDAVGAGVGGLVQEGVNGFVVPEQDSRSLSVALRKILDDDALRETMSQNARRIIKDWTHERMVKGFTDAVEYAKGGQK